MTTLDARPDDTRYSDDFTETAWTITWEGRKRCMRYPALHRMNYRMDYYTRLIRPTCVQLTVLHYPSYRHVVRREHA